MSLLRTVDRTSAVSSPAHARYFLAFFYLPRDTKSPRRHFSRNAVHCSPRLTTTGRSGPRPPSFASTLNGVITSSSQNHKTRQKSSGQGDDQKEPRSAIARKGPLKKFKDFAEKELKALVDYYGIDTEAPPEQEPPDEGKLIWNVGDAHEPWPVRNQDDTTHIYQLEELLKDDEAPHDRVFETYKKLQSPGVVYLRLDTIRSLLHHLSIVERPSPIAMQRFLSILEDMKTAHIHIIRSEWTSAIHLAGRAMGTVSMHDLQSALSLWRDMEHRAGVKGGFVTFNVLFNVAVKAGNYTLADTFAKEMQARKLPLHRHFRVSLIYYYGVLQNGNAVRKAYQELVAAGDIVDTVILNAVIAALIRAGEPSAAEHVFERMKRLHAQKAPPAPGHRFFNRNWRDRRQLALLFAHEARMLNKIGDHEKLEQLQAFAPIAPDSRTYAILIRYQAATAGNFERVNELLQEMRYNSVPLEGAIFIVVFQGFRAFGGVRYTSWTPDKLEKVWTQYLKALRDELDRTWLSTTAVVAALKAFGRCTNAERTMRAWEELREMWKPDEQELENVMGVLRRLVPSQGQGFFDENVGEKR